MAATQAPFSALLPQPLSLKDSRRAAPPFLSRPFLSWPSKLASLSISATPCIYRQRFQVISCFPSPPESSTTIPTKLYVSGLSFRTTEESLRNAFKDFGQLVEVKLVMDRIANRPRGFAFLRYATEEESQKDYITAVTKISRDQQSLASEKQFGQKQLAANDKFLDGRVIFVEPAKPRSELRQKQAPTQY